MSRIILFVVTVIALGTGCDGSKLLVTNDTPVRVSGLIEAQECLYSNPMPYAIEYQHFASLRFIRADGAIFSVRTDDSSLFAVSIDTGMYSIIMESGHTFPDTLRDIRLVRDTVINIIFQLDYLTADTIDLDFRYAITGDSLGRTAELDFLSKLNVQLGDALQLGEANRLITEHPITGLVTVNYHTPLREGFEAWSVSQSISFLTDNGIVPEPANFVAGPDYFVCHTLGAGN